MLLFLDFDGVLHPFPMTPASEHFSCVPSLWKILDERPDVRVVITSTWRERYSFAELAESLIAHGGQRFAARFAGTTPIIESASNYEPGVRQREVESWLLEHDAADQPYLILDDIEEYFDAGCKNLYLVDGATGLTDADAEMIPIWIESLQ